MLLQIFLVLLLLHCCFIVANAKSVGDCDFEKNICLWTNARGEDQFDWTRRKGSTGSIVTGPTRDHTTGTGIYLYIETSSPRSKGHVARLVSPRMSGPQCMIFWYHMYGINMGHLTIHVNDNGTLRLLWLKGGDQGHYWHKTQINLRETGEYKVEIDGVRGNGYRGDAAIDDISFHPGLCKEQARPVLYAYADYNHRGLMDQQGLPSSGPKAFQYGLHLQQESSHEHDNFYLICRANKGLKIVKTKYTSRKSFPCEPRDFFFSPSSSREGLVSFFVIDRGNNFPQILALQNDTKYCGVSKVTELFSSAIDLSVNLAHNSTSMSRSSQLSSSLPLVLAGDDNQMTCTKTLKQNNPWFEIKLDGLRIVYKVYVTTRHNCSHGDHLPNITVTIYDHDVEVSCQTTDRRAKRTSRVFLCQPPLRAYKIRLKSPGEQRQLTICEVIVNAVDSLEHLRGVRSETWRSISSSNELVTFLKSPKRHDSPDISKTLQEFMDLDFGLNYYGQRLTSFIQAPTNGRYTIYAMCDDQCRVWMKEAKMFSDLSFFEDLEYKKQVQSQLIFVPRYTGFRRWLKYYFQRKYKELDSCGMYMLEGTGKDGRGIGFMGVGWRMPNRQYNRPLTLPGMYWILPGIQMLHVILLEPKSGQHSFVVGQAINILMTYQLCCHGIYCPSCPKTITLQLLGHTFTVNSSLLNTCQWYNYTTSLVIVNHPGKYATKVLESVTNTSKPEIRTLSELDIKARILQSCLYQDHSCSWSIKGDAGRLGWVVVQTANNKGHVHFETQANATAWLHSPTLQPQSLYRSVGLCLIFRYRNDHQSSQLEVIVNTLYNKTVMWHLKGMQGSQWNEARIPWPDISVSQVLIKGKAESNSSVALSDIRVVTMKCSLSPKHAKPGYACKSNEFQCHNGVCVKSSLRCDGDYACVDKSDESNCTCRSSEYKCPDGKCLAANLLCNGLKECEDGSDETNCGSPCKENQFSCLDGTCVAWSVTCDGVWDCQDGSDEPDICSSLSCPLNNMNCMNKPSQTQSPEDCQTFRGPCSFEYGFCGFTTSSTNKKIKTKWQIKKGSTPTSDTGPSIDHTKQKANDHVSFPRVIPKVKRSIKPTKQTMTTKLRPEDGGSYLYLEASGLDPGDATELYSDWLKYENDTTCLQFWYHMWGRHVGALNVYVMTNQTRYMVWNRTGDAGPLWRFGQTPIYNNGSRFKFVFRASVGNGNEGDIAIDDVDLITGDCDIPAINHSNCKFESDFCNWESNDGWIVQTDDSDNSDFPVRDDQSAGIARTNPDFFDVTPSMISPLIIPKNGFKCLRFWFFVKTAAPLELYSLSSSNMRTRLWYTNKVTRAWRFEQLPLQTQQEYKLLFETAKQVQDKKLVIAVDDVALSRDSCQRATSMNENCKQRTTAGDCCVFPFVYNEKCYTYCIGVSVKNPWCSLTENFDRDGLKGTCVKDNTAPQVAPRCNVVTDRGQRCVFPFRYRGSYHYQCLSIDRSRPWCGTTLNVDRYNRWGYCDARSLDQCGSCRQKTWDNKCCIFPFTYRSKKYYSCTTSYYDRYWCSLTGSYDKDKKYGICAGYDLRDNCRTVYGKQEQILQWTPHPDTSSNVTWSPRKPNSDVIASQDGVYSYQLSPYVQSGLFELPFNGSFRGLRVYIIPDLESFTACVWIKTNDTMNEGTAFRYKPPNQPSSVTGFGLINYKKIVIKMLDKERYSGVSANDGDWHHLCLVWNFKGGVLQMYKDGKLVIQGKDWHKNSKINGSGVLQIGADGFVGKMSGMNVWSEPRDMYKIARLAVGCGMEGGDIMDWSVFSERDDVIFPPSCLDVGGNGYGITHNSTNPASADLFSNVFDSSLADNSTSLCLYFRYMLIGQAAHSLKIYQSDVNTTSDKLLWKVSSKTHLPLWRFGTVSLTTLQSFKIRVSAVLSLNQGSIGLAGYFVKPGYCSFSKEEKEGCQVIMKNPSGTFSSPYFPGPYPNNVECKWWISRPPGYVIHLKFLSFDLEDSRSCEDDHVIVYDGQTVNSNVLGKLCGNSFPLLLESSSNSLLVGFKSDNDRRFPGFKISYTSYKKESKACNLIENCPFSCTCSSLNGRNTTIVIYCKGLTAIPMKTPANTIAMMLSRNRLALIESSIKSNIKYMDLSHNTIMRVTPYSFSGLRALTTLRLNFNFIDELLPNIFIGLTSLKKLDLSNNLLHSVKNNILDDFQNLKVLSLQSNRINRIEKDALKSATNLTHLYLQNNLIENIPDGLFDSSRNLRVLYLNNNKLKKVTKDTFRNLRSLEVLYLDNNHIQSFDEAAFSHLQNLRVLKLDLFVLCCYALNDIQDLTCKSPSSAFSSCDDLMKNKTLQICIWILGILAFLGNIGVIIWRLIVKERNRVHSFLLTNLAVSDLMMGVYLLIIAIKDLQWRGVYFKHDLQWRFSLVCQLAGALSVVSSEVSVLILTTITADRYSSIVFAFKFKRLKMKSAVFVVSLIWMFGLAIAIVPILNKDYFYDYDLQVGFYGRSGVCLPLQLSQERFPGWEYSVAIFIGLNFIAFSFILVAYIIMFWKVRSAGRSVRSTQLNTESAMARKMAFIILTDFCCWMPIIVIGLLSLLGRFPDPEKLAYVWIAVFVLPVNSSINPVLYTFSNRTWWNKKQDQTFLDSIKSRVKTVVSRGSLGNGIEMTTRQSVINADVSVVTTIPADSAAQSPRSIHGSSRNPKINLVKAKFFEGEFSNSVMFYRSVCNENDGSMFLVKYFSIDKRSEWSREVEVIEHLKEDGGHPNIMKHIWHSPVHEAPILIDLTKLETLTEHGLLICYDLISFTTLDDYLSKQTSELVTQILLAIATDVINALSYLERCNVRHNHVTAKNILIKESVMIPSLEAVLGGFGEAAFVNPKKANDQQESNDIQQYGVLLEKLVAHSPNADPDSQIKEISIKCRQQSNALTAVVVRDMIEEVWDGTGTWDTLL